MTPSRLSAAVLVALTLAASGPVRAAPGEPMPAAAPSDPYELAGWCYGAMAEYLDVYERVTPDLRDIDKLFGSSVKNEARPYADDVAAAHDELKVLSGAVVAAEKASLKPIAQRGAAAVSAGRGIWAPAEARTSRELARAWLSWALPDRCDTNARELTSRSALLGQVLKYNAPSATETPPDASPAPPTPPVPAAHQEPQP